MTEHQKETNDLARRHISPIKVWVTENEKERLALHAAQAGLSLSGYLRTAGLHHTMTSRCDLNAVQDLGRINGDLGRIAGLLKLWLSTKRGEGAPPFHVEKLMNDFRTQQTALTALMQRVLK